MLSSYSPHTSIFLKLGWICLKAYSFEIKVNSWYRYTFYRFLDFIFNAKTHPVDRCSAIRHHQLNWQNLKRKACWSIFLRRKLPENGLWKWAQISCCLAREVGLVIWAKSSIFNNLGWIIEQSDFQATVLVWFLPALELYPLSNSTHT